MASGSIGSGGDDPLCVFDFPGKFRGTRVITLEQNYHDTPTILASSDIVIVEARVRYTKGLGSERPQDPPAQLVARDDEHEQEDFVDHRIVIQRSLASLGRNQTVWLLRRIYGCILGNLES